jgi:hypothetical protein
VNAARKDAELYLARTRQLEEIIIDQKVVIMDLLAALEALGETDCPEMYDHVWPLARDAIAKAKAAS